MNFRRTVAREGLIIICFLIVFFALYYFVINSVFLPKVKGGYWLILSGGRYFMALNSYVPKGTSFYSVKNSSPEQLLQKYKAIEVTEIVKMRNTVNQWALFILFTGYPLSLLWRWISASIRNKKLILTVSFSDNGFSLKEIFGKRYLILLLTYFFMYVGGCVFTLIFITNSSLYHYEPFCIVFFGLWYPLYLFIRFIIWAVNVLRHA